ncbi:MAG: cupin domain-containing protein [Aquabacterium sp.]
MPPPDEPAQDPVLDADTLAALADAVPALPVDDALIRRVRHRVLQRVAEDQRPAHVTVRQEDGASLPFGPGLTMKPLHQSDGVASYLVRLAPGAALPAHRHPVDEECVVLEGSLRIGELLVRAGGFHLGRRDALHAPIHSDEGALIFLRGAMPDRTLLV